MPTIKEILQEEGNKGNNELVLFLEGKFWKAYERSAFVLTKLYNFKPSKRYIKLVEQEIISVGFPMEQLPKYIGNNIVAGNGKMCKAVMQCQQDEKAFSEWKASTRIRISDTQSVRI